MMVLNMLVIVYWLQQKAKRNLVLPDSKAEEKEAMEGFIQRRLPESPFNTFWNIRSFGPSISRWILGYSFRGRKQNCWWNARSRIISQGRGGSV
jgi:hypothetical protein